MSLELKRVEKKVGQITHIYRTDLTFEKNTINILLGSTLAGKTTLMKIINQITAADSGEVVFNGENLQRKHISQIGYLPEECVADSFEVGEKVWCARYDLPGIIKNETIHNSTNYVEKYGARCYQVYVIELTNFESPYFGFQERGGFNSHCLAYDLGSLKHLEKYGAEI